MKKILIFVGILLVIGFGGYKLYQRYSVPLTGEAVADLGREHVTELTGMEYNSNPPTSGKHFAIWAKKGVYDRVLSDGYLIHSLEHGYIVISYDCSQNPKSEIRNPKLFTVFAHEEGDDIPEGLPHEATDSADASGSGLLRIGVGLKGSMAWFTPENAPEKIVDLPEAFASRECQALVTEMSDFYNDHKAQRLIVVPRPGMDVPIAVTAWNRILKMQGWDKSAAEKFLRDFENKGPEKTVE